MNVSRLLVVSCSKNKKRLNDVPAIELYDGPFFKVLRKFDFSRIDILILSAKYGLIDQHEIISFYDEKMNKVRAYQLRDKVSTTLHHVLSTRNYREVFFELGKDYLNAININPSDYPRTNIIFDNGTIGVRLHHFKSYLEQD